MQSLNFPPLGLTSVQDRIRGQKTAMEINDLSQVREIGLADPKKIPSSQHLFIDVVMIDKSHQLLSPLLYQVEPDHHLLQQTFTHPHLRVVIPNAKNSFFLLGEVLCIDREKKQIDLNNRISVTYRHLIVFSQTEAGCDHDFSEGLYALLEALRVRKNVSHTLYFPKLNDSRFQQERVFGLSHSSRKNQHLFQDIGKILSIHATPHSSLSLEMALADKDMRLYEIQLSKKNDEGL